MCRRRARFHDRFGGCCGVLDLAQESLGIGKHGVCRRSAANLALALSKPRGRPFLRCGDGTGVGSGWCSGRLGWRWRDTLRGRLRLGGSVRDSVSRGPRCGAHPKPKQTADCARLDNSFSKVLAGVVSPILESVFAPRLEGFLPTLLDHLREACGKATGGKPLDEMGDWRRLRRAKQEAAGINQEAIPVGYRLASISRLGRIVKRAGAFRQRTGAPRNRKKGPIRGASKLAHDSRTVEADHGASALRELLTKISLTCRISWEQLCRFGGYEPAQRIQRVIVRLDVGTERIARKTRANANTFQDVGRDVGEPADEILSSRPRRRQGLRPRFLDLLIGICQCLFLKCLALGYPRVHACAGWRIRFEELFR